MARTISIKKGRNLSLAGRAQGEGVDLPLPLLVRVPFYEFSASVFRCLVRAQDRVLQSAPLLQKKDNPAVVVVSPVSGQVVRLVCGERRVVEYIEIIADARQEARVFETFATGRMSSLSGKEIRERLLESGLWPLIRQRPFDRIADPQAAVRALFVRAMDTSPLAPDINVIMHRRHEDVLTGLSLVARLTDAPVYLCHGPEADFCFLPDIPNIHRVVFKGPHPAGNAGTHIQQLAPLAKGCQVWTMDIQAVMAVSRLFREGVADFRRVVAVTGEGVSVEQRRYVRALTGTLLENLTGPVAPGVKIIDGNPLWGVLRAADAGLGFATSQVTVLPGAKNRRFLGWLDWVARTPSFSRLFLPSGLKPQERSIDADQNGSPRAIVLNDVYDDLVALDVLTFFLIKAILAGELEEMERLGILECAPEDFALAAFVCPSKTGLPAIVARGLELMEKEGI